MTALTSFILPAVLIAAALNDMRAFKIPNRFVAILVVAWPLAALQMGVGLEAMGAALLTAFIIFLAGFALFAFNLLGAGDVKLLAATSLWVGAAHIFSFLFVVAIAGAAVVLLLLKFRSLPSLLVTTYQPWLTTLHERKESVPYGLAIAVGGIFTWPQTAYFVF